MAEMEEENISKKMLHAVLELREKQVAIQRESDEELESAKVTYNEPIIGIGRVVEKADLPDGENGIDKLIEAQQYLISQGLITPVGEEHDGLFNRMRFASDEAVYRAKEMTGFAT